MRQTATAVTAVNHPPIISVIIPVLREEHIIHNTIAHVRALSAQGEVEIIVVDGDPCLSTIKTLHMPGVITTFSAAGRAAQMNHGASMASGEILVFLHADTALPLNAFNTISTVMKESEWAAGAFDLGINSTRPVFRITEYYVYLRTRLTRIPFGDQAIFVRRSYFEKIGGYTEIPLMEDIDLMKRIRREGGRIRIIRDKVMTSPRRWEQEGILYCTLRNWALQAAYAIGVTPARLAKWYKW